MKKYFSVSETAKAVHMTAEALRHYDRIGLVRPSKKDEWTGYRYYTEQDMVRLNTVHALQLMDLPLQEIKQVLEYDDLGKIISFLEDAEKKADKKVAVLLCGKAKIQLAKSDFESKFRGQCLTDSVTIKHFPKRVVMLSDTLETPTLDNLWNYLRHFYNRIEPSMKEEFTFEDLAGVYTDHEQSRLFAVCVRYVELEEFRTLPKGRYLCADCTEENRVSTRNELLRLARETYHSTPDFTIEQIILSGVLLWNYQVQIYLGD